MNLDVNDEIACKILIATAKMNGIIDDQTEDKLLNLLKTLT